MKVTTSMFFDRFLSGIQDNLEAILKGNEQISSGKRVNRPSDDPAAISKIVNYNTQLTLIGEYRRATDAAKSQIESLDSAFSNLSVTLQRAHELAISGASSTLDGPSKNMIAKEVDGLLGNTIGIANTKVGDRYIFGGYRSNAAPIDPVTGEFSGDNSAFEIDISSSVKIALNIAADSLFSFKRLYTTDSLNAILPAYNWNNNGAITIPNADPISALYTSTGGFVNSSNVLTANGGALTVKVGDTPTQSSGGFVINNTNNTIRTFNGVWSNFTVANGIYTGASLAAAISASGAGVNVTYDSIGHKFTVTANPATSVDWGVANNLGKITGFTSAGVQAIGTGITSDNAVGDVNLAANSTLQDVRDAVNIAGAGVRAEVVNFGTSTSPDYRIVVASNPVGSSDKITITVSSADASGTGLKLLSYDKNTAVNMTLGKDIKNYNYFSDPATANDSIVVDDGTNNGIANNKIIFQENGGPNLTATIARGTYTPGQLATALAAAFTAAPGAINTYTASYDPNAKKFIINNTAGGATFKFFWANASSTATQLLGNIPTDSPTYAAGSTGITSNNAVLENYYSFNNNYLNQNNALRAINFLKVSLQSNDTGRVGKAIGYMNTIMESFSQGHAEVGARLNKLDMEKRYQEDRGDNINTYLSNEQDADIGKVYSEMTQRQTAMQGLRTISTDFLKSSLFDFLK